MSSLWIAIGSCVIFILLIEGTLWLLFRRKFCQICIPVEGENTFFHFFTIGRIRIVILLHCLSLIAVIVTAYLLLWP